jgi:hypothetical protein
MTSTFSLERPLRIRRIRRLWQVAAHVVMYTWRSGCSAGTNWKRHVQTLHHTRREKSCIHSIVASLYYTMPSAQRKRNRWRLDFKYFYFYFFSIAGIVILNILYVRETEFKQWITKKPSNTRHWTDTQNTTANVCAVLLFEQGGGGHAPEFVHHTRRITP